MFKTFTLGLMLGLLASAGLLYALPIVDLERERSIITVRPNGGNQERLHANLPDDRIMAAVDGGERTWPQDLDWPDYLPAGDGQTEVFKLRNDENRVVGVASRIRSGGDDAFIEWTIHMPARGTIYALLSAVADDTGARVGNLHAGTREFEDQSGRVAERFVAATGDDGEGRLEVVTSLVSALEDDEFLAEVTE